MQWIKEHLTPRAVLFVFVGLYAFILIPAYVITKDQVVADKYSLALASLLIGWWLGQADVQERVRHILRRAR